MLYFTYNIPTILNFKYLKHVHSNNTMLRPCHTSSYMQIKGHITKKNVKVIQMYRCGDKSLARPTSRCILFDGENISFDASLVIYINSTNISPIMIINRIYENQNLRLP